jgi:hypothetical protein
MVETMIVVRVKKEIVAFSTEFEWPITEVRIAHRDLRSVGIQLASQIGTMERAFGATKRHVAEVLK